MNQKIAESPTTSTKSVEEIETDKIIYFSVTEEYWDKPYVRKRHHNPETRTVILKGKVLETKGDEFKVELFENNDFEKDGQTLVFHKGCLLSNQNFTDFERLGQWKKDPSSNP